MTTKEAIDKIRDLILSFASGKTSDFHDMSELEYRTLAKELAQLSEHLDSARESFEVAAEMIKIG